MSSAISRLTYFRHIETIFPTMWLIKAPSDNP